MDPILRSHHVALDAIYAELSGSRPHVPEVHAHYLCQACGCSWDSVKPVECPSCRRECSVYVLPSVQGYDASVSDPRR